MNNNILVIYIGVAGIRSEDISEFVNKVTSKISPVTFEGEIITIPVQSYDTRVECINPRYVTDEDLIAENMSMIKKLREELLFQSEQLKLNKNG